MCSIEKLLVPQDSDAQPLDVFNFSFMEIKAIKSN